MKSCGKSPRYHSVGALLLALLAVGPALPATAEEPAAGASDPRAVALAERCLEAMGGAEAWEATRFLRFDFFGYRLHHWDRYTGRHRVEGKTREGQSFVLLENVQSREGEAWVDGVKLEGEAAAERLGQAYEMWVNDTYWLLMPYKLQDPGVTLAYDGEHQLDGRTVDRIMLSFGQVGLTPGDHYWADLDRESGLMTGWAYHLEDWEPERPRAAWRWRDWTRYGRIMLSPTRVNPEGESGPVTRTLGQLAVFDLLPDSVFTSPAPVSIE